MRLSELIAGLPVRGAETLAVDPDITHLADDSRTVAPGSLFIARRGTKADGAAFIPAALTAGASAVLTHADAVQTLSRTPDAVVLTTADLELAAALLAERFHGRPGDHLVLIGVTGTNGKTTTTFLIQQLLTALGVKTGLIGTVLIDEGAAGAGTTPASMTTPGSIELSGLLSRMVQNGCRACVMEVSSHALAQKRTHALTFDAAVFTNLTQDHLDFHLTMEAYADAKAILFKRLPPWGAAIVNAEDPSHARMLRDLPAGTSVVAVKLDDVRVDPARIGQQLRGRLDSERAGLPREFDAVVPLVGRFNAMNALQAAATVLALCGDGGGATWTRKPALPRVASEQIVKLLSSVSPPPGRLEPVGSAADDITALVDYAHTDDALTTVLTTLRESAPAGGPRRLTCVFGCGGDRDRGKRPKMGAAAARLADRVVITSDNPRTEDAAAIIDEILAGVPAGAPAAITIEPDRERAIHAAIASSLPGEIVLIAGKGHEQYQIVPDPQHPGKTISRHFDDREVARAALRTRASR